MRILKEIRNLLVADSFDELVKTLVAHQTPEQIAHDKLDRALLVLVS